jgi:23S rRNA G2445 N2-methylase RlmL
MRDISPPSRSVGVIITNPPYGERLGEEEELIALYRDLGQTLKRFKGWHAWVITNEVRWLRQLKMKPEQRTSLFNGQIRCEVAGYPIR